MCGNRKISQKAAGCGRLQISAKTERYPLKYTVLSLINRLFPGQRYPTPLRHRATGWAQAPKPWILLIWHCFLG